MPVFVVRITLTAKKDYRAPQTTRSASFLVDCVLFSQFRVTTVDRYQEELKFTITIVNMGPVVAVTFRRFVVRRCSSRSYDLLVYALLVASHEFDGCIH